MFSITTSTRYNAEGNPLVSVQKTLISHLSNAVESKNLTIDERNLTSTQWVEYHVGTKRKSYNTLPTSNITAEAVTMDGFTLTQTDNSGVTTTASRSYTATGMIHTRTDGRGNTTTTVTDKAGRTLTVTDARGKVKAHTYEQERGLLLGTTYSDSTTPRAYTYNHLGQLTRVTDAAGVRTLGYTAYGERISDSLVIDGDTHLITESLDAMGRSSGFSHSKNGTTQHTVTTGYGTDGRINSAGFLHGGAEKVFGYEYLSGSNQLHKLTKPNGMTLTQSYESHRNLLTSMAYHRGTTLVAQREYVYDILDRPTARTTARKGTVVNDTFAHNTRSELTAAQVNGENYQYNYDNIGNRTTATEGDESTAYTYSPYGEVKESANGVYQPIQWSSEYNDTELGLVYYNYRHYNSTDGRWLGMDPEFFLGYSSLYCQNKPIIIIDTRGLLHLDMVSDTNIMNIHDSKGVFQIHWKFRLDQPTGYNQGAYVVQKIYFRKAYGDCESCFDLGLDFENVYEESEEGTYWEAWFVSGDSDHPEPYSTFFKHGTPYQYHDSWLLSDNDGRWRWIKATHGFFEIKAIAKVFSSSISKELDDLWNNENKHPYSKDLPSTTQEPAWWNNPPLNGETVVNTSLRLDWDGCCEPPEKTIKLVQNGKILIEKGL